MKEQNPQKKPLATLNGWMFLQNGTLVAAECNDHPVLGVCAGGVRTSRVVSTDGKTYAETLNTFYKLGIPLKPLAEVCIPKDNAAILPLDIGN